MSKAIKTIIIIASVAIGLITITLVVLKILGIECPFCSDKDEEGTTKTKIKRNYTELILPDEA